jgi:hypothetical protein
MVLKFIFCVIIKIIDFWIFKQLMQKTYLFSLQIGMPQANALNFTGYMDTVLFLTISKPDIYHHRSLGKSATVFYLGDQKLTKLAADLPNLFYDRYPAYKYLATTFTTLPIVGKSTVSVYPADFRCICRRHSYLHSK